VNGPDYLPDDEDPAFVQVQGGRTLDGMELERDCDWRCAECGTPTGQTGVGSAWWCERCHNAPICTTCFKTKHGPHCYGPVPNQPTLI
jgi:hypothetical protein